MIKPEKPKESKSKENKTTDKWTVFRLLYLLLLIFLMILAVFKAPKEYVQGAGLMLWACIIDEFLKKKSEGK